MVSLRGWAISQLGDPQGFLTLSASHIDYEIDFIKNKKSFRFFFRDSIGGKSFLNEDSQFTFPSYSFAFGSFRWLCFQRFKG